MTREHKAPAHLSIDCQMWWAEVMSDYELDAHHIRLLTHACEAWDQNEAARRLIADQGMTFKDDRGNIRMNPAVQISQTAKTIFARLIRELDLDVSPQVDNRVGPPALRSNRRLPF